MKNLTINSKIDFKTNSQTHSMIATQTNSKKGLKKNLRKGFVQQTAYLLCIIVGCTGLWGCAKENDDKAEKPVISVLAKNSWYSNVDYAESEIVNTVIDKSGYKVSWKLNPPTTYYDTVRPLILAKNNLADIVQMPDLDLNSEYSKTGVFVKLDEYLEYMPNFKKYLEDNPSIKASLTTESGHIFYVPQTVHTQNYQPCIMYNMEWLAALGLEVPTTLDEFVVVLRAFKETDMNGNKLKDEIPLSVESKFLPYMFGPAFGLELVNGFYADEAGVVHYSYYEEENYKAYLAFLNSLYAEGLLESDFTSTTRDNIVERCKNNQTGVTFDFSWQMSALYSTQYAQYDGSKPVFCGAQPLSGKYEGYYIGRTQISGLFAVTATSANVVDAVKLLDYMMSEDAQTYYCWGIEGESYTVNASGQKEFTEQASDDMWLQKLGINPGCLPSRQVSEVVDAHLPKWHSDLDKTLVKYIRKPFPFIFATAEELEADHGYTYYIAQYVSQQSIGFITGKLSLNSYDLYMSTLKSMNIEAVIKVKQAQYDRYLNAQTK